MNSLELAKICQTNAKSEAEAVELYTEFLNAVNESELSDEDKQLLINTINELVADELNHATVLLELYTALTGIEPSKD